IGERPVDVVRHLRGRPERELAFAVDGGDGSMLLDRQVRVALVEKHVLEHVVRFGERLVHVAELESLKAVDVALLAVALDTRLGSRERLLGMGGGLERLVPAAAEMQSREHSPLRAGYDGGDRVGDAAYATGR